MPVPVLRHLLTIPFRKGGPRFRRLLPVLGIAVLALGVVACGSVDDTGGNATGSEEVPASSEAVRGDTESAEEPSLEGTKLVIYSGRNENLIGPILDRFQAETGIEVEVRYGETAELAATLLEEGERSPADVYIAQDAGALGAVSREGLLAKLSDALLERVDPRFRSPAGEWVGLSGRARVLTYNPERLSEADLPASVLDLTAPEWKGRLGWAPTNGSFQAFVTAMRATLGEDETRAWLEGMLANEPRVYPNNTAQVEAAAAGEIDIGLVNHYYLYRLKAEHGEDYPAANYFPPDGDIGALINVAGAGILRSAENAAGAAALLSFLLSEEAQRYFAEETYEFPLVDGVEPSVELPPLQALQTPDIDLGDLWDLEGTLKMLSEVGAL